MSSQATVIVSNASATSDASSAVNFASDTVGEPPKVSVEAYLALESASGMRHEYVRGKITAMSGETPVHNRIAGNFYTCFDRFFEERDCEVYIENIRLRTSPDQFRYPDVVALCGVPQFDSENPPCLLNPTVLIEVLSPSTEAVDRGEKLAEYRSLSTLTDYVMIAQDRVFVEHCVRQSAVQWTLTTYTDLENTLHFAALGVALSLREMYRKTALAAPQEAASA